MVVINNNEKPSYSNKNEQKENNIMNVLYHLTRVILQLLKRTCGLA